MKPIRSASCLATGVFIMALTSAGAAAPQAPPAVTHGANWAYWRGPSGQGYSDDTRVPLVWSETKNVLWKTKLPGLGNSSPVVWGERLFLTSSSKDGKERHVLCVRTTDGKILWQKQAAMSADAGKTHTWNGYASASCATDGKRVYAFFGTPGLFCYDFEGNLVWKESFGVFTSETGWGTAASPFLFEDLVIQNCDNDGPAPKALPPGIKPEDAAPMALVALDKATGKVRWQTPRNQGRGFSTPVLIPSPAGTIELVLNGPNGVWAYDPSTGKEIWHCERKDATDQARFGEPIPVFTKDVLFAASGRPGPFQAVRLGGAGDVSRSHLLWEVVRKGHRDVSSQILWKDLIYAADTKGVLTCHDPKTGKALYNERIGAKSLASPLALRGKLLFLLDEGETVVIEPGPALKVAGSNKLDGGPLDYGASPAIAAGRMFIRSQSQLYCIGEKQ